jgi:hypothetical protein
MPLKSLLDQPDDDDDKVLVEAAEAGRAGPGAGGQRVPTLMAEVV